jgi:hypothetical protein
MKTTNNAQKTVNGQIRKMVLRGAVVIVSLVLISWSVGAQSYLDQVLNGYTYGKMAMTGIEETQETLEANATIHAIEAVHLEVNNPASTNFDAIEAKLELQVEDYSAADFIETELSTETETWMNTTETNFETIETALKLQVEVYDAAKFVETELSIEAEKMVDTTSNKNMDAIEAGLVNQVEGYNAARYVETDFSAEAEAETAKEADQQVEKYATQQLSLLKNTNK